MRATRVKTIRALDRGLEVMLRLHEMRAASLHDLHRATGLPRATLTRILLTLEQRGLVWQRIADGAYLPGHSLRPEGRETDDTARLVEIASPILARLCTAVQWPSILAVPRLHYMEVIETNSPRAYFHHIPLGPIGFRVNMLRSATGRAYLAHVDEAERAAILERLRASQSPGDTAAHGGRTLQRVLDETRRRGYAVRDANFGGHYDKVRREWNDGRDSIAVPLVVDTGVGGVPARVIGCVNLTWIHRVTTVSEVVGRHLPALRAAADEIAARVGGRSGRYGTPSP